MFDGAVLRLPEGSLRDLQNTLAEVGARHRVTFSVNRFEGRR